MKNILFTLFLGLFTISVFAQDIESMGEGNDPAMENKKIIERLDEAVELTEQQKTSVSDILTVSQEEMSSIKQKYQPTINSMKDELKAVREKYGKVNDENRSQIRAEIQTIKQKYDVELRTMKSEFKSVRKLAKDEINKVLSVEQRDRLKAVRGERRDRFQQKIKERRDQRQRPAGRPRR